MPSIRYGHGLQVGPVLLELLGEKCVVGHWRVTSSRSRSVTRVTNENAADVTAEGGKHGSQMSGP